MSRPEPVAVSLPELQAYAGNFYSHELDVVYALKVRDGDLLLELREEISVLIPYAGDRFGWRRRTLQFSRDGDRAIIGFALSLGRDRSLNFRKVASRVRGG